MDNVTTDSTGRREAIEGSRSPIELARGVVGVVSAEAAACETLGRLTDKTFAALSEARLFGLLLPKCYGGMEAGALEALEALETICEADGSTGWVLMACNVAMGTAATYLPDAGVEALFGTQVPIIAGQGAPRGHAIVDGDGYRLSGRWSYGSGVLHANYLHSGGMVFENGAPREALTFIVPIEKATFLGNWDVIGLRATGSVDYSLDDVYVPKEFTHSPNTRIPRRGSDLYRIGIVGLSPLAHGAFALGVARRALNEIVSFSTSSGPRQGALNDSQSAESFHERYGAAEGKLRAGRAFLYDVYGDVEQTLRRHETVSDRQITLMRLSLNHVTSAATEICTFAYQIAGGAALRNGVLQRCFRDMMAGSQHRIVSQFMLRECARELLGLADGKIWTSFGLTDIFVGGTPR